MLDCLVNYIGLKSCGDENPGSGQFINSLPGISLDMVAATFEREQATVKALWQEIQLEAYNRFYIDFLSEINKCHNLSPYCDYNTMICDNLQYLTLSWKYLLGSTMMQFRIYTERLNTYTTVKLAEAKELKDHYDVEYEKALKQAALLIDTSTCCADCGGNPKSVVWLP